MNSAFRHEFPIIMIAVVSCIILPATGCHMLDYAYVDELAYQARVTTPSVDAARAATPKELSAPTRAHGELRIQVKDGTVTHRPLFFHSPAESPDNDDGLFALSSRDYVSWLHESGRFLACVVLFPIHAVETPPWALMNSDGNCVRRAGVDGSSRSGATNDKADATGVGTQDDRANPGSMAMVDHGRSSSESWRQGAQ